MSEHRSWLQMPSIAKNETKPKWATFSTRNVAYWLGGVLAGAVLMQVALVLLFPERGVSLSTKDTIVTVPGDEVRDFTITLHNNSIRTFTVVGVEKGCQCISDIPLPVNLDGFSAIELPFQIKGPVDNSRVEMIKLHTVPIVADLTVQFELRPKSDERE